MAEGSPEGYTPEQLDAEKSRTLSDAELIKEGAEYEEKEVRKILVLTPEQIDSIKSEHNKEVIKRGRG